SQISRRQSRGVSRDTAGARGEDPGGDAGEALHPRYAREHDSAGETSPRPKIDHALLFPDAGEVPRRGEGERTEGVVLLVHRPRVPHWSCLQQELNSSQFGAKEL